MVEDFSRRDLAQFSAEAQVVLALARPLLESLRADKDRTELLRHEAVTVASLAAKAYSDIFPSAYQALIDAVETVLEPGEQGLLVRVSVKALSKEPLAGLVRHAAACVAILLAERFAKEDPTARILEITLKRSAGGRLSAEAASQPERRASVIVLSDSRAKGEAPDLSGPIIQQRLEAYNFRVVELSVIPDDPARFEALLRRGADELALDCIVSSGGTGIGPGDLAPELTRALIEREIPGVSQAMRAHGQRRTPLAMLSRGVAGVRGRTLIVNLPGSPEGAAESLDAVMPELLRVFAMMSGESHP